LAFFHGRPDFGAGYFPGNFQTTDLFDILLLVEEGKDSSDMNILGEFRGKTNSCRDLP
jgi:hypothetical protein